MATDTNFVIKFNTCSSDKISKCLSLKCIQNNDDRKPLSFALTAVNSLTKLMGEIKSHRAERVAVRDLDLNVM